LTYGVFVVLLGLFQEWNSLRGVDILPEVFDNEDIRSCIYPGIDIGIVERFDLGPFVGDIYRFLGVRHIGFRGEVSTEKGCVFGEFC